VQVESCIDAMNFTPKYNTPYNTKKDFQNYSHESNFLLDFLVRKLIFDNANHHHHPLAFEARMSITACHTAQSRVLTQFVDNAVKNITKHKH